MRILKVRHSNKSHRLPVLESEFGQAEAKLFIKIRHFLCGNAPSMPTNVFIAVNHENDYLLF